MSNRNDILEGIKDCLKNISSVSDVVRKFVFFDQVTAFPYIMVLGGDENLEDTFGGYSVSRMTVRVAGYARSAEEPEKEQCRLIEDVLSCLDNDSYNTQKEHMRPIKIETDEGMLHMEGEGVSMFVLTLEMLYRFRRDLP